MEKQIEIIVGPGIGGQREIIEAVENEGFQVKSAGKRQWPRDHYVYHNGIYVKRVSTNPDNWNPFGEGGNIREGKDFLLVSDRVYISDQIKNQLSEKSDYDEVRRVIAKEGERYFPNTRIHAAPTGYFHGRKGHDHLDMIALLLPKSKILVLDTYFGKRAGTANEYNLIAEAENLRLIRYNGFQDGVWFPLNSLVLPKDNLDIVFVDSKAVSLRRLLEQEGIKSVGIDMPQHEYPAGKINCQTNICESGKNIEELLEKF